MEKGIVVGAVLAIGVVALLLIAAWYALFPKNPFWDALLTKAKSGQTVVYFNELTDFPWDTVCVLEPYSLGSDHSREKRVKERIKADLGPFKNKLPNLNDDSSWAFVFIKDGQVASIIRRGRGFYLYKDYESNCLDSKDAVFFAVENKLFIRGVQGGQQ